jgi:type III restriction enzyme
MELKDYQSGVLRDLDGYLNGLLDNRGNLGEAFANYWKNKGVFNQSYKNNVRGVPHVCVKVPTAGGKTFIAVNAIDCVFDAFSQYNPTKSKFVVWLVPSLTILEQTVKNLDDIEHPYRMRLNDLFSGRVKIYQKSDVLQGAGFNADTVKEQLSIVVMSFDSLKATNKENRKAYQENGYLASFLNEISNDEVLLPEYDKTALINVIRTLKPLVIVDESHNAESALSVDMLSNLNPSFIFDLTATPRNNSNIISYVDAMSLKRQNMVKLPVIVANQRSQEDVIMAALKMRRQLEEYAKQEESSGGAYIRPIVLFQAEPKNKDDTTTFEKVKKTLIDLQINPDEIAIKTASINELKNVDLMSRDCKIRYIITINALKEGWDCPFAYVLATLANKSSIIDVAQILGRVLRLPHVRKNKAEFLNLSYVFTSSSHFQETLSQVVEGLNKAGFSARDYREVDMSSFSPDEDPIDGRTDANSELDFEGQKDTEEEVDHTRLDSNWEKQALASFENEGATGQETSNGSADAAIEAIKRQALEQSQAYEKMANTEQEDCPTELKADMNSQKMKPNFSESANALQLPQFFIKVAVDGGFFESNEQWQKLSRENLLTDFLLANLDASINFTGVESEVFQVDAQDIGNGESAIEFKAVRQREKEKLNSIIRGQPEAGQVRSLVARFFELIGKNTFYPIDDNDVKAYLRRIIETMTPEQRGDCLDNDYVYVRKIKDKVNSLADSHGSKKFGEWLTIKKLELQPSFVFPSTISPSENAPAISKSLYVREGKVNNLEATVIRGVAELENVVWWHRNLERGKGFCINGFVNHYPDFMVMTSNKNVIVIETKGDDRDNTDSKEKLKLGKAWENGANQIGHSTGYRYHYMMVFETNPIEGAHLHSDVLRLVAAL